MRKFKVWDVSASETEALEIEAADAEQAAGYYCDGSMEDEDAAEVYVRKPSGERIRVEVTCEVVRYLYANEVREEEEE